MLTACGGSDSNDGKEKSPTTQTGVFIDSEVANIAYKTASKEAFTNSKGEFQYLDGESVTFSVGGIELPSVKAQSVITPLDITKASNINDTQTANIARFLQSLDSDPNTDGIQIAAKAHEKAKELQIENIDFAQTVSFESAVSQLIADSGSPIKALVSKAKAVEHVQDTLDKFSKEKNRFFEAKLVGKTFYNTYYEEDQGNKWIVQTIQFNENNQGTFTTGDAVTSYTYSVVNGLLRFAYNGKVDFTKIQTFNTSLDAYEICWLESINENIVCSGNSIDYLFSDEQKAKNYVDSKNSTPNSSDKFSINMVGKTATSVITKTGCKTKNSWSYSFTNSQITQTGSDIWDDQCQTGEPRTIKFNVSEFKEGEDYAFGCKNYPTCTEADFNRTLTYTDGGRSIVSTFTLSQVNGIVITYNSKATENDSTTVTNEVITIQ